MTDRVSRRGKKKTVQFRGVLIIVFYFYIFLIKNGYKRFTKTNLTDLKQRVQSAHCKNDDETCISQIQDVYLTKIEIFQKIFLSANTYSECVFSIVLSTSFKSLQL